ncbi:meiotic nuclear division protein 1 homolog [Oncorhynchus keta]|uniref:meiotic nuclear division protein 1 homolog n=1 Tax=Oncorhynchus keta TaxID=8018 RepID=UPI0015F7F91E|nr:meiotic nuclear division protein 1 homolog [Oncorhynchus keta]
MSVKEVLQSLVDDNMVDCDRVGTSDYYWAFPSKALHARTRRLEELDKQHTEEKQRKMSLQQAVDKSKVGREETEERATLLKELQALREKRSHLKAKLEKYRECDPEVIEEMRPSPMSQLKRRCPDGQITSLPSSRGRRGTLVSMMDASIKPSGYLKT